MSVSDKTLAKMIQGTALALLLLFNTYWIPLFFTFTNAQPAPLFSITLIVAGDNNLVRRQYASEIASNLASLGTTAKLVYLNLSEVINRAFFAKSTQGATFNEGGYDIGFLGWAVGNPIPDFRSFFDGRPAFLAPSGNNYALYNNPELNMLFDRLSVTTDVQAQVALIHKIQEIIFNDAPYNYIYEPVQLVARKQKWASWGRSDVYSRYPDIEHWSGGSELTLAIPRPVRNLNPAITCCANVDDFGSAYHIYWSIIGSGVGLQDLDPRDLSLYPALATSIQSTADGLDWTIKIRQGATFQSGVEITADDFVWTRWALLNPKTGYIYGPQDVQHIGNIVDFTFLNGTTATLDTRAKPDDAVRHSWWKSIDRYTFEFHLAQAYAFTRQVYTTDAPLPKHIMEKFPPETWDNQPFSTASHPYTYTWDTKQYAGSGSYTAVGPVGAGPYYLESYNFTTNTATLRKYHQYWNTTGLQALGQFTVETYKVVLISEKGAALTALRKGEVDQLSRFYSLLGNDRPILQTMDVNIFSAPSLGWQELGFNMKHPILGTGVDTPVGKNNPSNAAEAARHVRKAVSHLIPRDKIVNQLLNGTGYPLASFLGPGWGVWHNSNLKPDAFGLDIAADELRAAGYTVGGISSQTPVVSAMPPWLIGGGLIAIVALTSSILVLMRRRRTLSMHASLSPKTVPTPMAQPIISTGYSDLDRLLAGGIPQGHSIVLVSPSCDERDLLVGKIIDSGFAAGTQTFYLSSDIAKTRDLIGTYAENFYALNPLADKIASGRANLFKIPDVGDLSNLNITSSEIMESHLKDGPSKIVIIDFLTDLLLRNKALTTRKWLSDFAARRKAAGFTILGTLDPSIAPKQDIQTITGVFDGIIEIYEKPLADKTRRFLVIRKMYGRNYSEDELLLDKQKLL